MLEETINKRSSDVFIAKQVEEKNMSKLVGMFSCKPLRVVSFDIYYREGSKRVVHYQVSTVETTGEKSVSVGKEVGSVGETKSDSFPNLLDYKFPDITDSSSLVQDDLKKGNKNELEELNNTQGTVIGESSQPSGLKGTVGSQPPQ